MPDMVEKNIVILVGDLGAGTNHLKNMLLLSQQTHWPRPFVESRLEYIIQNIYTNETTSDWLTYEYRLRIWKQCYGVDISNDYADINTPQVKEISQTQTVVFISHWPEIANRLKIKYPGIRCIGLYPASQVGFSWQIKAYINKIGIDNLQNFSFLDNIESNKKQHIDQHGIDHYHKTNVLNMIEIMRERVGNYRDTSECSISIEDLISTTSNNVISSMIAFTGCEIDMTAAQILHNRWLYIQPKQLFLWPELLSC
jgi:hypothetical protein